jgi:3-deoxy-7-phosphoheptulonate synthase
MYRGDIVNGIAFEEAARRPDPERMFRAYAQSAATLSHLETLDGDAPTYTCHEALLLPYEQALVRRNGAGWHGSSAHFLWVGDRTRFKGSAHVEFLRGLGNPLGIKCGPSLEPELLLHLLERLNPARIPGRITLISRMGAERIGERLPPLLRAVAAAGHPVLWSCDPMHGNTIKANGYKTRPLAQILRELAAFFAVCAPRRAAGVPVEMTGATSRMHGRREPVREADLGDRYHTTAIRAQSGAGAGGGGVVPARCTTWRASGGLAGAHLSTRPRRPSSSLRNAAVEPRAPLSRGSTATWRLW